MSSGLRAPLKRFGFRFLIGISALAVLVAYQNCAPSFQAGEGGSNPLSSLLSDELISQERANLRILNSDAVNENIDLSPFFSIHRVPSNVSTTVLFEPIEEFDGNRVILATKFNEKENYEVFVVTPEMILIRYEIAPKIFGNDPSSTNALRRSRSLAVRSQDIKGTTPFPDTSNWGSAWFKRYVKPSEQGKVFVGSQSTDHFNYSNGQITKSTGSFSYMSIYYWFDFRNLDKKFSFMKQGESLGPILRISQQWGACNIEQYEYAQGYGFVAWRSLIAESCLSPEKVAGRSDFESYKNHHKDLQWERFFYDEGTRFQNDFYGDVYQGRVQHSFKPGNTFIEDYPFYETQPHELIVRALRNKANRNNPVTPINPAPVATPPPVNSGTNPGSNTGSNPTVYLPTPCATVLTVKPKATSDRSAKVKYAYCMVLNRPADQSGLTAAVNGQGSIASLISSFLSSSEFSNSFLSGKALNSISHDEFLKILYRRLLQREIDSEGRVWWLDKLNSGTDRSLAFKSVIESSEFIQKHGTLAQ